jgi:DNA repair exonuclease SbcCD ATPase subunit
MFSKIKAKNFLSWEDLDYEIPSGLSQITGWNEDDQTNEGSGKSAILNAASWAIYGCIPKDAKIDDVVRQGTSSTSVELTLLDGHKIVRTRGPNDLRIIMPKTLKVVRGKDARDTQKMVQALVGLSFEAFSQIVYFAQNDPRRFVNASEAEKAAILSEILDLSHFDRAKDRTSALLKEAQVEIRTVQAAAQVRVQAVDDAQRGLQQAVRDVETFKETLDQEVLAVETRIDSLKEKRAAIEVPEEIPQEEIGEVRTEVARLRAKEKSYDGEVRAFRVAERAVEAAGQSVARAVKVIKQAKEDLAEYQDCEENCPTCGGPATEAMLSKTKRKVDSLRERMAEAKKAKTVSDKELVEAEAAWSGMTKPEPFDEVQLQKAERLLKKLSDREEVRQAALLDRERVKIRIQNAKEERARIMERSDETVRLRVKEAEGRLAKAKAEVASDESAMVAAQEKVARLSVLKDGFPEIKRYVFRTFLSELSRAATRNLRTLFDQTVCVGFSNQDEDGGAAKIQCRVTIDGQDRPLALYSGGQHRRIQIAIDLALSSAVASRTGRPISLRVLDEPFKDLSDRSIERALALLKSLPGSTVLIEHSSLAKASVDQTFHCVLTGGVSRRA